MTDPRVKTFDEETNQTMFLNAQKIEGCTIPKISLLQLEGILILLDATIVLYIFAGPWN